jgi:hypothetical protein
MQNAKKQAQEKDEARKDLPAATYKEMTDKMATLPPKTEIEVEGESILDFDYWFSVYTIIQWHVMSDSFQLLE